MNKNTDRREKFRILGAAITAADENRKAWKDRNGDHQFEMRGRAIQDPEVSSKLCGPAMNAMQWQRTIRP